MSAARLDLAGTASELAVDPMAGLAAKSYSTRTYLIALALALVAPVLLAASVLAYRLQDAERRRFEQSARETASNAVALVEREIRGLTRTLQTLATSHHLRASDFDAFRRQAREVGAIERNTIVLRGLDSRQLVNTAVREGDPLPTHTLLAPFDQEVLRTGEPVVTGHLVGFVDGVSQIAVVVPVRRDGEIVYLLSGGLPASRIRDALRVANAQAWRTAAIDKSGTVITRVRNPDISGSKMPHNLWDIPATADGAYVRVTAIDGTPSGTAFARTSFGWVIGAGASEAEFIADQRRRLGWLAAGSLALLLLALGLALPVARRIGGPIAALAAASRRLREGAAMPTPRSGNREIDTLALALSSASADLAWRTRALEASEARCRIALRVGRIGAWEADFGTKTRVWTEEGMALFGLALPEGRGRIGGPDDEWRKALAPEHRDLPERVYKTIEKEDTFQVEYAIVRPDGERLWLMGHGEVVERDGDGKALRLINVAADISDRKRAEAERERMLAEQQRQRDFLERLIAKAPIAIAVVEGEALTYSLVNPTYQSIVGGDGALVGRSYDAVFPEASRRGAGERLRAVLETGDPWHIRDFQTEIAGRTGTTWWEGEALRLPLGAPAASLLILTWEITERKRSEETRRLLINELNHRVKNTLASVQAMAHQTLRGATTVESGRESFSSRLLALARAHDVLTQENWEGADLRDVAAQALAAFADKEGKRIAWSGPHCRLQPKAALAIAMALHELATNALKYGALSNAAGTVDLRWSIHPAGDGVATLELVWTERGGPPVAPPQRRGFGSRMIERNLALDLDGEAAISFDPHGVVYTIRAPLPPGGGRRDWMNLAEATHDEPR